MDHDAVETRLQRVERFLDSNADGWRDERKWRRGAPRGEPESDLIVDPEKTKAEREALGLTGDPNVIEDMHKPLPAPARADDELHQMVTIAEGGGAAG